MFDSSARVVSATSDWDIALRRASFSGLGGIGGAGSGSRLPVCDGMVTSSGEESRSIGGAAGFFGCWNCWGAW